MKSGKFEEMNVTQLVEHFTGIALAQDAASRRDEIRKYNRLYDEMEEVKSELKRREGDQRRALLPLLNHPNAQVRLKSAIALLAIAPEAARGALDIISARNEYPQAADARGMIRAVDEGSYVPS
jgi:hypothetical protein